MRCFTLGMLLHCSLLMCHPITKSSITWYLAVSIDFVECNKMLVVFVPVLLVFGPGKVDLIKNHLPLPCHACFCAYLHPLKAIVLTVYSLSWAFVTTTLSGLRFVAIYSRVQDKLIVFIKLTQAFIEVFFVKTHNQ